jgi:hypothetical protein
MSSLVEKPGGGDLHASGCWQLHSGDGRRLPKLEHQVVTSPTQSTSSALGVATVIWYVKQSPPSGVVAASSKEGRH